ncbi:MAG: ATPase, T2SS/T4P/T4SS family [Planctomycetota bacterium]|nr:ATPase, T2SS/T4P/T4SS family [Planctomycetota bacterium]
MSVPLLSLAEAYTLVSPWKPFLLLIPFIPWAIVVSKVLDKHAARFILPRQQWGATHVIAGLVAVIVAISIPMKSEAAFWIGWGSMVLILIADVVAFALITNKDDRVPEQHRLTIDFSKWSAAREEAAKKKLAGRVELVIKGPDKQLVSAPQAGTPEFDTRVLAETALIRAIDARASQVDFVPGGGKDNAYAASLLVDAVRTPAVLIEAPQTKDGPPPPPPGVLPGAEAVKIMDFWRTAAKFDVNDRRKKQMADVMVERGMQKLKVRVSSIGAQAGLRTTLVLDPEGQVRRKVEALGLLEPQVAALKELVEQAQGLVLITSPPDSGRTTTLYSVLKMHDAYTRNVQTLEIELQDTLEGIRQNKFEPAADGPDFATTVRSILRRDPDVVGVAEMPDAATAKEAAKVDAERCRVYLAFKADNALAGVQTYVKAVGDPEAASKTLRGVIAQRLVRKLCQNCRVPYTPSADMLKKLGLPADKVKQLFKKGGQVLVKNKPEVCPACAGVGYIGLEGAFEIFPIGEGERALIKAQDWNGLRMEMRKRNLPTAQQAALRKALDGITSVEEITRAMADEASAPAPKPPPPATGGPRVPAAPAKS